MTSAFEIGIILKEKNYHLEYLKYVKMRKEAEEMRLKEGKANNTYIIEQIEHLRDEHGRGKRQRFAAHAALGKVDLPGRLFLFQTGPSFLLTFCHIFTDSDLF